MRLHFQLGAWVLLWCKSVNSGENVSLLGTHLIFDPQGKLLPLFYSCFSMKASLVSVCSSSVQFIVTGRVLVWLLGCDKGSRRFCQVILQHPGYLQAFLLVCNLLGCPSASLTKPPSPTFFCRCSASLSSHLAPGLWLSESAPDPGIGEQISLY